MRRQTWLIFLLLTLTVINYPNPFSPKNGQSTTIECTGDITGEAVLYIYDMAARLMARKNVTLQGGTTARTSWNGYTDYNEIAGNGVYIYQVIDRQQKRLAKGKLWVIN